jgi:hypothetical protein
MVIENDDLSIDACKNWEKTNLSTCTGFLLFLFLSTTTERTVCEREKCCG